MLKFNFWERLTRSKPNPHERKEFAPIPINSLNKIGAHLWNVLQNKTVKFAGNTYKLEMVTPCANISWLHIQTVKEDKMIIETFAESDLTVQACNFHENIYKSKGWNF